MKRIYLTCIVVLFLVCCKKANNGPDPFISFFSPESGVPGNHVTIYGRHFDSVFSNNQVYFNGIPAEVIGGISDTILVVNVPNGVSTGKISVISHGSQAYTSTDFVLLTGGNWVRKADFPDPNGRIAAVGFALNGKGYVAMGRYDGFWDPGGEMFMYDPATNTWAQKASPVQLLVSATAVTLNNKAYVGIGRLAGVEGLSNRLNEYDPETNTWTIKADFPGTPRQLIASTVINGKGYFGLGFPYDFTTLVNDFWEYDPIVDKWTRKADIPIPPNRFDVNFGLPINDSIAIFGGYVAGENQFLFQYNSKTDVWTKKKDPPFKYPFGPSVMVIKNKPHLMGDTGNWSYDWLTDTWKQEPFFDYRDYGIAFSIGDHGYYGVGAWNSSYLDLWEYTSDQ